MRFLYILFFITMCGLSAHAQKFRIGYSFGFGMGMCATENRPYYINEQTAKYAETDNSKDKNAVKGCYTASIRMPMIVDFGAFRIGFEPGLQWFMFKKALKKPTYGISGFKSYSTFNETSNHLAVNMPITLEYCFFQKMYNSPYLSFGYMPSYSFLKTTDQDLVFNKYTFNKVVDSYLVLEVGLSNWFSKKKGFDGQREKVGLVCMYRIDDRSKNTIFVIEAKVRFFFK